MKIIVSIHFFALVTILFYSCNKVTPAGFWANFKPDLLAKNISDQGPWGGHRAMYWKAKTANTFSTADVRRYAKKNGWEFVDSVALQPNNIQSWYMDGQPIFPLSSTGFSSVPDNNAEYIHFPRWINSALKVYAFKTGWVTIEPGSDKSTEKNGFVVISNDGTEMSVYHLWGE